MTDSLILSLFKSKPYKPSYFNFKGAYVRSLFSTFKGLKKLCCHRFMRKCSGRLEIMGKACFLYGPEFGCRIGRGAEASPQTVTSICSIPLVSIGYSTGVWVFDALAEAPLPQNSPGENFTGLKNKKYKNQRWRYTQHQGMSFTLQEAELKWLLRTIYNSSFHFQKFERVSMPSFYHGLL